MHLWQGELAVILIIIDSFLLLFLTVYGCLVGLQRKIDHNLLLLEIFIPANSCLLMCIYRRQNKYHPTIFEGEGEFHLEGSQKIGVW